MSDRKVNVAIVGLGFGAEFIPIYQAHPHANLVAVCQRSQAKLDAVADHFKVPKRYTRYEDLLNDPEVHAVHINTPIPDHAAQSIAALKKGKHVACTVPMATTVEECREIVRLVQETGLTYTMMETVVYAREFLFVRDLYLKGDLGKIQFLQASHQQDMDGWPGYWPGLPPMYYATHCVGPCLALTRASAEYVSCFGSGRIRDEMVPCYGSPFAVETTHIKLANSDLTARIYRSLFDVARQYRESFDVYGSKQTYEWPLVEGESPVLHTARKPEPEIPRRVQVPDFAHRLPGPLQRFTTKGVYDHDGNEHLSFTQGGGHGGSHPHLAHMFISALRGEQPAYPNAVESANWTCTGILAHESALQGGVIVRLPDFTLPS